MLYKLGIYLVFLWITFADVSANYVVSDLMNTWQDAKSRGNFATPKYQVDNSSFTVNITSDLKENEKAWVGYYMKETAFAYIENSPGLCYSMCNKYDQSYIGLNKDKCYCISEKPDGNISLPACNISLNGNWIVGGGDEYMSIYERIKIDIGRLIGNGKCLAFEYYHYHITNWRGCQSSVLALCKKGESFFIVKHNTNSYFPWRYYVRTCFKNGSYPITFNDIINSPIVQAFGPSWSNIVRSDVIYTYNETSNSISRDDFVQYGYITKRRSTIFLSFSENRSTMRYYLQTSFKIFTIPAIKPITGTSISTLSTGTMASFPSSPSTASVTLTIFTYTINSTVTFTLEGIKSKANLSSSENSDVIIAVSVSVVILVIVVVAMIILKRRGKLPGVCIKCTGFDTLAIQNNKNMHETSQGTAYGQCDEVHIYKNLEVGQHLGQENCNDTNTYCSLEQATTEDQTYDSLDSRKN